ncbi:MAG: hypothetical protein QXI84_01635 [Thermofilaceae archaeon]
MCCSRRRLVKVARASDIAKLIAPPTPADEVMLKFGKIFEEEYSFANYIYRNAYNLKRVPHLFIRKVAARLREKGIYSRELVVKAYKAYSALIAAGVVGLKPKTRFRAYSSIRIAAQPDLRSFGGGTLYEFKLCPIDAYARVQSSIFAYVWESPIKLVGLVEEAGRYRVEMETIPPPRSLKDLGITPELVEMVAQEQLWCTKWNEPVYYERCCECESEWIFEEDWEEEWEEEEDWEEWEEEDWEEE